MKREQVLENRRAYTRAWKKRNPLRVAYLNKEAHYRRKLRQCGLKP